MIVTRRDSIRLWRFALACLCALAIGSDCSTPREGKMSAFPSFDTLTQAFETRVDDGGDGSIEASDVGTIVGTSADPGVLSTSTTTHQVSFSAFSDSDSVLSHCEHSLSPGSSETACTGTVRARFDVEVGGFTVFYLSALTAPNGAAAPASLSSSLEGEVSVDCGVSSGTALVYNPAPILEGSTDQIVLNVEGGSSCQVTIVQTAIATTTGLAAPASFVQTVSVSAVTTAIPDCTESGQCPPEAAFCDSTGVCGTGDEGSPALVAATHCATPFVSASGCSYGVSGSTCRGDFECADGYACSGGVCVGDTACATDIDCSPSAPICTEQGTCSTHGEQGEGCVTGLFCRAGLICLSNRCTVILGEGEDCSAIHTTCDGPYVCFPSTQTCESPLPLGSSCAANIECQDFPLANSCNAAAGNTCSARQGTGGPCAQDIDCAGFGGCDQGTGTCN